MTKRYPNDITDPATDRRRRSSGRGLLIALMTIGLIHIIAMAAYIIEALS